MPKKAEVKKGKAKAEKKKLVECVTPEGTFSFPYLAKPDTGREYSDDKYKVDLYIDKEVWKNSPDAKKLKAAVLQCAQENLDEDIESFDDFTHPFKDTDRIRGIDERLKGCIMIRCKSTNKPIVVGALKNEDGDFDEWSDEEIATIKGGDIGRFKVAIGHYTQGQGGVTLFLNIVQFKQEGTALGNGRVESLKSLGEMEVEADDLDGDDEEEEAPKKKGRPAKKVEEEETEDDTEEVEEEEEAPKKSKKAPKGKPGRKAKVEEEEEEESEEDEEEEEEEEEEAPRKGKKRPNGEGDRADFEF